MNTRKLIMSLIVALALTVGLGSSLPVATAGDGCKKDNSCNEDKDDDGDDGNVVDTVNDTVDEILDGGDGDGGDDGDDGGGDGGEQTSSNQPQPSGGGDGGGGGSDNPSTETQRTTATQPATTTTGQPTTAGPPPRRPANARPRQTDSVVDPEADEEKDEDDEDEEQSAPTADNPSFSVATPGAVPIGVPNFFIDKFRIPPFLLSIYQSAGTEYGVPWQVLAAINEIETDYGRNLNVSSAGAMGWMQFIPSSWKAYGVDANGDGRKDPYNPVDAIFAAARYLRAAGAEKNLRQAIFAYNHADWYVDSVMLRAKLIGGLPDDLVGALTGLTQGHFPVAARATYADDISARRAAFRRGTNPARTVEGSPTRRGIDIYSRAGAPVIAVNDGVVKRVGYSKQLGRYVVLQDVYGNVYTYARLGKIAPSYPSPKPRPVSAQEIRETLEPPAPDPRPASPASAGRQPAAVSRRPASAPKVTEITLAKERLFAHPGRPASYRAGGEQQLLMHGKPVAGYTTYQAYFKQVLGLDSEDVVLRKLRPGAQVIGGTVLGRIEKLNPKQAPHVHFLIRPAGKGAPLVDPKPILDGWKLLESTAIYRAAGKNPFFGPDARNPSIGQILLLSKGALQRRVLADPRIEVYGCGRRDILAGQVDRRVLATLAFLTASGLKPRVTSLKCGHSYYTTAGGVSHHSSGNAVDIAAINGIPILGHQGPGSITEIAVRRLMNLQGIVKPAQIISLMKFEGAPNTVSMSDHHDHIHVGFRPLFGNNGALGEQVNAVLKPEQWVKLIGRLSEIDNPVVPLKPSKSAIPVKPLKRASRAHSGE
jgi:murein DD-endopeptidase MepM/ murein hydrolase activator NlpD